MRPAIVGPDLQLLLRRERDENLRRIRECGALKAFLRHSNDGHRPPIDQQRASDDAGVGTEACGPVAERQHGHRSGRRTVVVRDQYAAESGSDT